MSSYSVGDLITRTYSDFRGVDFRNKKDDVSTYRSPNALNMWKNYHSDNCIECRPQQVSYADYRTDNSNTYNYTDNVIAMYLNKDNDLFVHAGTKLYKNDTEIYTSLSNTSEQGFFFQIGNNVYYKSHESFVYYNGTNTANVSSIAFIPTTSMSGKPTATASEEGSRSKNQDVNLLTDVRKNSFIGDGANTYYHLDTTGIDTDYTVTATINGTAETGFTVDYTNGVIHFTTAPVAPATSGQDNVIIQFRKTVSGNANKILKCKIFVEFDNRLFASGNPDYPNKLWHCSVDSDTALPDPTYWSDLDYYTDGEDGASINTLIPGNDVLWSVKGSDKTNNGMVYYHTPTTDSSYGKIYPSTHSNVTKGCNFLNGGINFYDDIVYLSTEGLESVSSSDIQSEQVLEHRSSFVDPKMVKIGGTESILGTTPFICKSMGYMFINKGKYLFLADHRSFSTVNDHNEYEWFEWELPNTITCMIGNDSQLLYSYGGKVYTIALSSDSLTQSETITCFWSTPEDEFYFQNHLKSCSKRGCVAELVGNCTIYIKGKKDFNPYIKYRDKQKGYVVIKPKEKKWKALQIKFVGSNSFKLYNLTTEAYLGAYVKR